MEKTPLYQSISIQEIPPSPQQGKRTPMSGYSTSRDMEDDIAFRPIYAERGMESVRARETPTPTSSCFETATPTSSTGSLARKDGPISLTRHSLATLSKKKPFSRKPSSWRHPGGTMSETEEGEFSEAEAEAAIEHDMGIRRHPRHSSSFSFSSLSRFRSKHSAVQTEGAKKDSSSGVSKVEERQADAASQRQDLIDIPKQVASPSRSPNRKLKEATDKVSDKLRAYAQKFKENKDKEKVSKVDMDARSPSAGRSETIEEENPEDIEAEKSGFSRTQSLSSKPIKGFLQSHSSTESNDQLPMDMSTSSKAKRKMMLKKTKSVDSCVPVAAEISWNDNPKLTILQSPDRSILNRKNSPRKKSQNHGKKGNKVTQAGKMEEDQTSESTDTQPVMKLADLPNEEDPEQSFPYTFPLIFRQAIEDCVPQEDGIYECETQPDIEAFSDWKTETLSEDEKACVNIAESESEAQSDNVNTKQQEQKQAESQVKNILEIDNEATFELKDNKYEEAPGNDGQWQPNIGDMDQNVEEVLELLIIGGQEVETKDKLVGEDKQIKVDIGNIQDTVNDENKNEPISVEDPTTNKGGNIKKLVNEEGKADEFIQKEINDVVSCSDNIKNTCLDNDTKVMLIDNNSIETCLDNDSTVACLDTTCFDGDTEVMCTDNEPRVTCLDNETKVTDLDNCSNGTSVISDRDIICLDNDDKVIHLESDSKVTYLDNNNQVTGSNNDNKVIYSNSSPNQNKVTCSDSESKVTCSDNKNKVLCANEDDNMKSSDNTITTTTENNNKVTSPDNTRGKMTSPDNSDKPSNLKNNNKIKEDGKGHVSRPGSKKRRKGKGNKNDEDKNKAARSTPSTPRSTPSTPKPTSNRSSKANNRIRSASYTGIDSVGESPPQPTLSKTQSKFLAPPSTPDLRSKKQRRCHYRGSSTLPRSTSETRKCNKPELVESASVLSLLLEGAFGQALSVADTGSREDTLSPHVSATIGNGSGESTETLINLEDSLLETADCSRKNSATINKDVLEQIDELGSKSDMTGLKVCSPLIGDVACTAVMYPELMKEMMNVAKIPLTRNATIEEEEKTAVIMETTENLDNYFEKAMLSNEIKVAEIIEMKNEEVLENCDGTRNKEIQAEVVDVDYDMDREVANLMAMGKQHTIQEYLPDIYVDWRQGTAKPKDIKLVIQDYDTGGTQGEMPDLDQWQGGWGSPPGWTPGGQEAPESSPGWAQQGQHGENNQWTQQEQQGENNQPDWNQPGAKRKYLGSFRRDRTELAPSKDTDSGCSVTSDQVDDEVMESDQVSQIKRSVTAPQLNCHQTQNREHGVHENDGSACYQHVHTDHKELVEHLDNTPVQHHLDHAPTQHKDSAPVQHMDHAPVQHKEHPPVQHMDCAPVQHKEHPPVQPAVSSNYSDPLETASYRMAQISIAEREDLLDIDWETLDKLNSGEELGYAKAATFPRQTEKREYRLMEGEEEKRDYHLEEREEGYGLLEDGGEGTGTYTSYTPYIAQNFQVFPPLSGGEETDQEEDQMSVYENSNMTEQLAGYDNRTIQDAIHQIHLLSSESGRQMSNKSIYAVSNKEFLLPSKVYGSTLQNRGSGCYEMPDGFVTPLRGTPHRNLVVGPGGDQSGGRIQTWPGQLVQANQEITLQKIPPLTPGARHIRLPRKRHQLRGPFGQMLMEEMAKSELSKQSEVVRSESPSSVESQIISESPVSRRSQCLGDISPLPSTTGEISGPRFPVVPSATPPLPTPGTPPLPPFPTPTASPTPSISDNTPRKLTKVTLPQTNISAISNPPTASLSASHTPTISHAPSRSLTDTTYYTPSSSLTDASHHAPSRSLTDTSHHTPSQSLTDTSHHAPSRSLTDTSYHAPSRSLTDSSQNAPSQSLTDASHNAPSQSLTDTSLNAPSISLTDSTQHTHSLSNSDTTHHSHSLSLTDSTHHAPSLSLADSTHHAPSLSLTDSTQHAPSLSLTDATPPPGAVCHQRTQSSPCKLECDPSQPIKKSPDLNFADLSSDKLIMAQELLVPRQRGMEKGVTRSSSTRRLKDTRALIVREVYQVEKSYVESLQFLVIKYLHPLKNPENAHIIENSLVDDIFFQIPNILLHHETFLDDLKRRLDSWDPKKTIGDWFLESFTKKSVLDAYTAFIRNVKRADDAIRIARTQKPAFDRFLQDMRRERKGERLSLTDLLAKPHQRIPRYRLLIQRLIEHTEMEHPDYVLLRRAEREIHELALKISAVEKETNEQEVRQQVLRQLEVLIHGLAHNDLLSPSRTLIRHDLVTMSSGPWTRKDRCLFLFNDLLVMTSVSRRGGRDMRQRTTPSSPGSLNVIMDSCRHKLWMYLSLTDVEISKAREESLKKMMKEYSDMENDVNVLNSLGEGSSKLHCPHKELDDIIKTMLANLTKQVAERQAADPSHASFLQLNINNGDDLETLNVVFQEPEKKAEWEEAFTRCKDKMAELCESGPPPDMLSLIPIRKTRAGLQFTCAAPTIGLNSHNLKDVWVCNSDGYVGQVCVLSLRPEPTVICCNGVCNARILSIVSVPSIPSHKMDWSAQIDWTNPPTSNQSSWSNPPTSGKASGSVQSNWTNPTTSSQVDWTNPTTPNYVSSSLHGEWSTSDTSGQVDWTNPPRSDPVDWSNPPSSGQVDWSNPPTSGWSTPPVSQVTDWPASTPLDWPPPKSSGPDWAGSRRGWVSDAGTEDSSPQSGNPLVLDSSSSEEEEEELVPPVARKPVQTYEEDSSAIQATMWLGTEDGTIHVYNCTDNIRIKKNKDKFCHPAPVLAIVYLNNQVFAALGNGDIVIYSRDSNGVWDKGGSVTVTVGSATFPVTKMVVVAGNIWAGTRNTIKVLVPDTKQIKATIVAGIDESRGILSIVEAGWGVWVAQHGASTIRLLHSSTHAVLTDLSLVTVVGRMLSNCDDIIRQHKTACLRVTALMAVKDTLWVGTSAGVIITLNLPHLTPTTTRIHPLPTLTGNPHGHTGHVRFLTSVEMTPESPSWGPFPKPHNRFSFRGKTETTPASGQGAPRGSLQQGKMLVISGGEGYEDFSSPATNDLLGREDSTNHLLLWTV